MQSSLTKDKSKLTRTELVILIVAAVVTITFVSTCSPLYPFNPWNDINCFFTMGRGILRGLVPYRDLFDHKGPVIYFVYALAALISDKTFAGAWIIECAAACLFAVFSWKTVKLLSEPSKYSIALMPLFLGVIYTCKMFNFGGNAEELFFPLITVVLYFAIKGIIKGDGLPADKEAVICGVITGTLFWVKYTFLGFVAGFCLYIFCLCIKRKDFKRLGGLIWRFLAGFLLITIPVIIYFAATGTLGYLWEVYFGINFSSYTGVKQASGLAQIPVIKNIYLPVVYVVSSGIYYPGFGIPLLLTLSSMFFITKEHRKKTVFLFLMTFALAAGFIFTRPYGIYYYPYILCYGFGMGLIPLVKGIGKIEKAAKERSDLINVLLSGILVVFYIVSIMLCKNMYLFLKPKDSLAQFRIAETINETPDAKILTYSVMDEGFYTAAGLLPANRFFGAGKNLEDTYPAIHEEQDRLISEGYYDYIITSVFCEKEWDNYVLVREEIDPNVDYTGEAILVGYRLYERA